MWKLGIKLPTFQLNNTDCTDKYVQALTLGIIYGFHTPELRAASLRCYKIKNELQSYEKVGGTLLKLHNN